MKYIELKILMTSNKEKKIKRLEKRYTLGGLNFDAVIIADFDESLKSVGTLFFTRMYHLKINIL